MTAPQDSPDLVQWLSRPEHYAHHPAAVERRSTHISHVFLAGELVFKLKKPVRYDFLDFSTVEKREWACREELRLNRRLAEHVYLDVVPVHAADKNGSDSGFAWQGPGPVVDWLVKMQRLPLDRTLDVLLEQGAATPEMLERLAERLAAFHRALPAVRQTPDEYRQRLEQHVAGNRRELLGVSHHLDAAQVRRIHSVQLQMLALEPGIFDTRVAAGRVVEGHGDLRPEHVCFTDPPVVFDCVEFSQDFRQLDMADEWSFLAMECEALGARWAVDGLRAQYEKRLGDAPPRKLWAFYQAYRACVRGKVAALRADQLQPDEAAAATRQASRYLELADQCLKPWRRPLVLLVGGLSGTGKSTVARAVAESLGAEVLRTDVLRQELFPPGGPAATDAGVYSPANRQRVYDALFAQARTLVTHDQASVVLDGTFGEAAAVAQAHALAAELNAPFVAVECVCPPEVAMERIRARLAQGTDASEARPELHLEQRARWQAWPAATEPLQVDTTQTAAAQRAAVLARLRKLW